MKTLKKLSTTLLLLCVAGTAIAQDVIVKKDQSTVMSKVLEITSTEIKYKKWDNQDGPTYSVLRSEVVSINYENGEMEKFSDNPSDQPNTSQGITQQTFRGFMEQSGSQLKINGHILSKKEVQNLFDEQDYQLYLKGENQCFWGYTLAGVGGAITLSGLGLMLFNKPSDLDDAATKLTIDLITVMLGVAFIPPGAILAHKGGNKLQQIAEKYNLNHGLYSLNVSPTLMKCETPQGNCGLGLTLSLNF